MTNSRARAYRRVVETLTDTELATLSPPEQACILEAAVARLFCCQLLDGDALRALEDAAVLTHTLIEAGRWPELRAHQLLDDLLACGPERTPAPVFAA